MQEIYFPFIFVFGLIVGSFLNVAAYALIKGKSIFRLHSACPNCKHKLGFWDLIPLFSYIGLQGRCHYCKKPISIQYPIVELLTGIVFVAIYQKEFGGLDMINLPVYNWFVFAFWLLVFSLLIIITVTDLKEMLIYDEIMYPLIIISFLFAVIIPVIDSGGALNGSLKLIGANLLSGFFGFAFFFFFYAVSKGAWMGGGDVKMGLMMGLLLGWPKILLALMIAFILGSIIGIAAIVLKIKKMKDAIPFGPFLILGTLLAYLWSDYIISQYMHAFGLII